MDTLQKNKFTWFRRPCLTPVKALIPYHFILLRVSILAGHIQRFPKSSGFRICWCACSFLILLSHLCRLVSSMACIYSNLSKRRRKWQFEKLVVLIFQMVIVACISTGKYISIPILKVHCIGDITDSAICCLGMILTLKYIV